MGLTSYPHIVWCVSWNLPKFLLFLVFLHVCMLVIARPQYSFVYVLACYLAMVAFAFCSLVASLANHQRTFCTLSKTKFGELATPFDTLCHPFSFSQSVLVPETTPQRPSGHWLGFLFEATRQHHSPEARGSPRASEPQFRGSAQRCR